MTAHPGHLTRTWRGGRRNSRWFGALGWRDPHYLASHASQERVKKFVAMLLILQRASYLAPASAGVFGHNPVYRSAVGNALLLAFALAWNVALVVAARRRGWFPLSMVGGDIAVTCVLLFAVSMNTRDVAAIRRRCAAEAEYVRTLLRQDAAVEPTTLGDRLAQVAVSAGDLGLRVRYATDSLAENLPEPVVTAIADASREALNNVAIHSGAHDAWLTAFNVEGRVIIRVVDRGRGFDPQTTPLGFGLSSSIVARMHEIGGRAHILAAPGDGVCVELTWPESAGHA